MQERNQRGRRTEINKINLADPYLPFIFNALIDIAFGLPNVVLALGCWLLGTVRVKKDVLLVGDEVGVGVVSWRLGIGDRVEAVLIDVEH